MRELLSPIMMKYVKICLIHRYVNKGGSHFKKV